MMRRLGRASGCYARRMVRGGAWAPVLLAGLVACGGGDPVEPSDAGAVSDGGPPGDGATADARVADGGAPSDAATGGMTWRAEPDLPVRVQEIAAVVVDGKIWVAGGFEGSTSVVATVRIFDPASGAWSEGPALPFPRHHLMLVALGSDLYALGGMRDLSFESLDTGWVLEAGADDWLSIATLPEPRSAGIAAAIDGRIYLAAGQTRGGVLAEDTLVYDPATDEWTRARAIGAPREHLAGFAWDGELWAVGGRELTLSTNTSSVEIYDPVSDAWREGPPLALARGGFGAAVVDGVAYVVGGEQPDRALDEVESLALPDGEWSPAAPVPTPRHGHAVVATGGRVYVIGGADEPIFAAVDAVESYGP